MNYLVLIDISLAKKTDNFNIMKRNLRLYIKIIMHAQEITRKCYSIYNINVIVEHL